MLERFWGLSRFFKASCSAAMRSSSRPLMSGVRSCVHSSSGMSEAVAVRRLQGEDGKRLLLMREAQGQGLWVSSIREAISSDSLLLAGRKREVATGRAAIAVSVE